MKRAFRVFFTTICVSAFFCADAEYSDLQTPPIMGIWENSSRFLEFTHDSACRIVLKPWYGFVYEPYPFMNCRWLVPDSENYSVAVLALPSEKKTRQIPLLAGTAGIYTAFYIRTPNPDSGARTFDGFWERVGAGAESFALDCDSFDLSGAEDRYCWFFAGGEYFRVRYWLTDREYIDADAALFGSGGERYTIPRYIRENGRVYACVTLNDENLRHYERGLFYDDSTASRLLLYPEEQNALAPNSYKSARYMNDFDYTFADDSLVDENGRRCFSAPYELSGNTLALGNPDFVPASFAGESAYTQDSLDSLIEERNSSRRPPRKPILEYMDLDFHWDEVERLRGTSYADK